MEEELERRDLDLGEQEDGEGVLRGESLQESLAEGDRDAC